ncbi:hypothetical protein RJ640_014733 [Escallonia rubra]|uniref:Uncharacterized protein n=1 Tax=Escallonia rubra TaxID=112253 RepID=A0AA88S1J7_9ASTE|nr:hypothetical protein RJ640_014733 [Escallonia rubra]
MRKAEDHRPAYWSYTSDHRFEPIRAIKTSSTSNPNQADCIPVDPPRSAGRLTTSTPSSTTPRPSSTLSSWRLRDAESKRRKRVAEYKAYAVEGKMKASLRSSFHWVKSKYSSIVHGY